MLKEDTKNSRRNKLNSPPEQVEVEEASVVATRVGTAAQHINAEDVEVKEAVINNSRPLKDTNVWNLRDKMMNLNTNLKPQRNKISNRSPAICKTPKKISLHSDFASLEY